jgi:hypothetical protein
MIDTQQQYINLNIRGEISIIVVQVHSGRKRDICTDDDKKESKYQKYIY